MNDTHPKINAIHHRRMMGKSSQTRMKMGFDMFDLAKKIVMSRILVDNPGASEETIRKELFVGFYESDFSSSQRRKIIAFLKADIK